LSQHNTINVNQPSTVNAVLETGGIAETMTVQANASLVQTATSGKEIPNDFALLLTAFD
jgi:hypothetical protein